MFKLSWCYHGADLGSSVLQPPTGMAPNIKADLLDSAKVGKLLEAEVSTADIRELRLGLQPPTGMAPNIKADLLDSAKVGKLLEAEVSTADIRELR